MFAETNAVAVARPYTNPVHPPGCRKAPARTAPMRSQTTTPSPASCGRARLVVTMTRSRAAGSTSRLRDTGARRPREVGRGLVGRRDAALPGMPVRVVIHSSDVSRNCEISSLVSTRSGTWTPSAEMRARGRGRDGVRSRALVRAPTRRRRVVGQPHSFAPPASTAAASTIANISSPRQASWPSTVALTAALPTGPCTDVIVASRTSVSPGLTTRLKRTLSIPAKRPDSSLRPASARSGHCRGLGKRFDDQHAGHDLGFPGEVPGEPEVVVAQRPPGHAAYTRLQLVDLVDQQEGRAVRQQRLDLTAVELHGVLACVASRHAGVPRPITRATTASAIREGSSRGSSGRAAAVLCRGPRRPARAPRPRLRPSGRGEPAAAGAGRRP